MPLKAFSPRFYSALLLGTALLLPFATPAQAQREKSVDDRVERLEKEMRAVQRKVFPDGAGQIVAPDQEPTAAPQLAIGSPATTPLTDLTGRVDAIESQLARMTGQVEENGFRQRQLETANQRLTAELSALREQVAAMTPRQAPPGGMQVGASGTTAAPAQAAAAPALSQAQSQARTAAVAAISKPSTGNAAEDSYIYGYRLWNEKFFPEAQMQLQQTVEKFPTASVASRAANLLGRAYLDDGKPTQAAKVLFDNYRERPNGDRAAESLARVGEALIQLKRPKDACLAYEELAEAFAGTMPDDVRTMMQQGRARAKCGG